MYLASLHWCHCSHTFAHHSCTKQELNDTFDILEIVKRNWGYINYENNKYNHVWKLNSLRVMNYSLPCTECCATAPTWPAGLVRPVSTRSIAIANSTSILSTKCCCVSRTMSFLFYIQRLANKFIYSAATYTIKFQWQLLQKVPSFVTKVFTFSLR